MNIVGASILALLLGVVFFASKRMAAVGMMAGVLYLTLGQVIDLFGIHLYAMRILTLAGLIRVLFLNEFSFNNLNGFDKFLLAVYAYRVFVFIANGNGSAVNSIGLLIDISLAYFTFRGLLDDFKSFQWLLKAMIFLLIPYVALVSIEMITWHNPFLIQGATSEVVLRNGRPRCIGSFAHPTILGTFGASFLPLYMALYNIDGYRKTAAAGVGLCLAIVLLSNSGGPLSCAALGIAGWMLWIVRTKMFIVRRTLALLLILLVMVMKAPIWYLPAKLSIITGGDGWHRSYLMDVAFQNLDQWWFAGMSVLLTKDWFPYIVATGGADIINYYLDFGIAAGLISMGLFIALLVDAFSRLGNALIKIRSATSVSSEAEYILWALGTVLAMHIFNWFGLVYFDQYYVVLFMQFAAISTLSDISKLYVEDAAIPVEQSPFIKKPVFHRYKKKRNTAPAKGLEQPEAD